MKTLRRVPYIQASLYQGRALKRPHPARDAVKVTLEALLFGLFLAVLWFLLAMHAPVPR